MNQEWEFFKVSKKKKKELNFSEMTNLPLLSEIRWNMGFRNFEWTRAEHKSCWAWQDLSSRPKMAIFRNFQNTPDFPEIWTKPSKYRTWCKTSRNYPSTLLASKTTRLTSEHTSLTIKRDELTLIALIKDQGLTVWSGANHSSSISFSVS